MVEAKTEQKKGFSILICHFDFLSLTFGSS